MKKILLALATVAALFATSCKNESINPANELKEGEFLATIDKNLPQNAPRVDDRMSQKTTINGFAIYWQADDEISINGAAFKTNTTGSTVVFVPTDKSAPLPEGPYHAFYGAVQKTDDAQYNYATLPAQQTFNTGIQDERKIISNIPLYAYSETKELTFHNVFAILKINIPTGVTASSIEISANEVMNGEFKVEKVGDTYTAVMTGSATAANTKTTVVPQSGSFAAESEVYVAIPAKSYTGLAVKMNTTSEILIKKVGNLTLEADKLYNTNITFVQEDNLFHFTALENGCTVEPDQYLSTYISYYQLSLQYSTDGTNWNNFTQSTTIPALNAGDKVFFKANGINTRVPSFVTIKGQVKVSGNIMYLLSSTASSTALSYIYGGQFNGVFNCSTLVDASKLILPATNLVNYCFSGMFYNCTGLVNPPELPATTLTESCYSAMFKNCTSLENAPELPATTLANYCYEYMFEGCTNLKNAPELPIKTLKQNCYCGMFKNCTSLENAPALPASSLENNCYSCMFYGCTNLKNAPELSAQTMKHCCYLGMFYNCTSLENAPELPATTLASYCYCEMFYGCTSLENAPALRATTLYEQSYYKMFLGCSSLKSVTMLATNVTANACIDYWLSNAGTSATNPTLTVVNNPSSNVTGWANLQNSTPANWTIKSENGTIIRQPSSSIMAH